MAQRVTQASDTYKCLCAAGFTGDICESDINECASSPCLHGGTCVQGVDIYTCTCTNGYTDTPVGTCFTEMDECSSDPCLHAGTCFDHVFSYSCVCARGFSGYNCEINDDDCSSSPCMNAGVCQDLVDKFTCSCKSSFAGTTCSNEVDACIQAENDCDTKHSECIHVGVGVHECVCYAGYETSDGGETCTNIAECSSSPCMNSGACKDGSCTDLACIVQYSCQCTAGWAGDHCEVPLNECASYPCQVGGTCIDSVNAYQCVCGAGYEGYNCEVTSTSVSPILVSTVPNAKNRVPFSICLMHTDAHALLDSRA